MKKVGYLQDMMAMVAMKRSEFVKILSLEGTAVFHGFEKLVGGYDHIKLKETGNGFHLCLANGPDKSSLVEFIQIWGNPLERLETRFNYIERKVDLPVETREAISNLLGAGGFVSMKDSPYGNMRLKFQELPRPLGEGNLEALMDAIVRSISLLKECQPRE